MAKEKSRLDVLLVDRGFAPSREKAKALIMAGDVFVNGQREDKPGTTFDEAKITSLEVKGDTLPYVSRGGLKLEKAVNNSAVLFPASSFPECAKIIASFGSAYLLIISCLAALCCSAE